MFEKLIEIFPSLIDATPGTPLDTDNYHWFTTAENKLVGIPKENMSHTEQQLLETFLTPFHASQPPITDKENQWIEVLYNRKNAQILSEHLESYRFVYFSLSDDTIDPSEFREAVHGLYPNRAPIIWENSHEGIIIEENPTNQEDSISYDEIIDVLMSDFYMNVRLYISSIYTNVTLAATHYQWVKKCFQIVQPMNKSSVINYVDAVPALLLENVDETMIEQITTSVLRETADDDELLHTIKTFLECNSNATLAAKKLYMHRNSLQYRVDKFIEKTGIDVKQFHGALTVYLTLVLKKTK